MGQCVDKEIPKFEARVRSTFNLEHGDKKEEQKEALLLELEMKKQKEQEVKQNQVAGKLLAMLLEPEKIENHKNFAYMFEA